MMVRPGLSDRQYQSILEHWRPRYEGKMSKGRTTEEWSVELCTRLGTGTIILNWWSTIDVDILQRFISLSSNAPLVPREERTLGRPWVHQFIKRLFPTYPSMRLGVVWTGFFPGREQKLWHNALSDAEALQEIVVSLLENEELNTWLDNY